MICVSTKKRVDNRNLKFFKKNSIIAQFKAFNEKISEWAYFLNLDEPFQRYLHFKVPTKGFLWKIIKGKQQQQNFLWFFFFFFFCSSLGINLHNFLKNHPIFKNTDLFYANFALCKYVSKKVAFGVWGLRTRFGLIGAKRLKKL